MLLQASVGLETHGPLGTLWVSAGLIAFYIALIWLNSLLGLFLTPLFIIPQTRLLEYLQKRKRRRAAAGRATAGRATAGRVTAGRVTSDRSERSTR